MLALISSDGRLVREALRGAQPALEELVRRYQQKAHAVARAHLPRGADPEDAVQEAFCQALRDLPGLRQGESFGPWFLSIVRNISRREARRIGRFGPLDVEPADPRAVEPLEWGDLRATLWREVRLLPPLLREAVLIYYHEGQSVRAVARAQGVSTALARKRLQLGRDRLRKELWRRLGDEINDLLPSARSWRRKARQATLFLLLAAPGGTSSAAPAAAKLTVSTLGVLIMANKSILVTALLLALLGVSFWAGKMAGSSAESPARSPLTAGEAAGRARLVELQAIAEKSARRLQELEAQNEALRRKVAGPPVPGAAGEGPADPTAAGGDPADPTAAPDGVALLDCSALAGLLARNVDLLPGGTKDSLSPEEEARMLEMHGELMKLRGRGKSIGPHPFFRPEIFDELTGALFGGPLHLSAEQMEKLREINRSIGALPEHPEELTRVDQHRLREDMVRRLWEGVEGLLDDEQKERWVPVRAFSEIAFTHGGEFNYGVENTPEVLASNLRHLYSLEKPQLEVVRPFAEALLGEARQILARYGQSQSEIDQLPAADKLKLEDEFLDLQSRFEVQLDSVLPADQKKALLGKEFSRLRFAYGKGIPSGG